MFFQQSLTTDFSSPSISQILHFLRLHQMVYQLTLVITIMFFRPIVDTFELLTCFILILLITPTFLLLQDVLGKKDDEKVNQKRILFSDTFNKLFFCSNIIIMSIILYLNNIESLISYGLLFISTIGYAATKRYRKMILSYTFRYLSSIFTISVYLFVLVDGIFVDYYPLILIVSVLDLVGNMAGDIRDGKKDSIAGVKTLFTTKGRKITLEVMFVLILINYSLLIIQYKSLELIGLFACNIILFIIADNVSTKLVHGIFHLGKLVNYLTISFVINDVSVIVFGMISIFIIMFWFLAYYFYLHNSGFSSHV